VFVWAWLNVGELPRFDNQLPHLAALSFQVDFAPNELFEFANIKRRRAKGSPNRPFSPVARTVRCFLAVS
jgi:hypothetical protein